jgi:hypothetical protein
MVKNYILAVMWRSICKVPVNGSELGLRRAGKTCKLCSWAGFVNFKIQNRELQFARSDGANRSFQDNFYRWRSPDKHAEITCHDKLSK